MEFSPLHEGQPSAQVIINRLQSERIISGGVQNYLNNSLIRRYRDTDIYPHMIKVARITKTEDRPNPATHIEHFLSGTRLGMAVAEQIFGRTEFDNLLLETLNAVLRDINRSSIAMNAISEYEKAQDIAIGINALSRESVKEQVQYHDLLSEWGGELYDNVHDLISFRHGFGFLMYLVELVNSYAPTAISADMEEMRRQVAEHAYDPAKLEGVLKRILESED